MFEDDNPWTGPEIWMRRKLLATRLRWTRQMQGRFWQDGLGIAVELRDPDQDHAGQATRRRAAYDRSVMVITVDEFNEEQASEALAAVGFAESWNERRRAQGLPPLPSRLNEKRRPVGKKILPAG